MVFRTPFCFTFPFLDLFEAQRNTCSGLPCLWQGEGSVIHFGSFSSFFLRRKPTSLEGISATGFICAQKEGFFPSGLPTASRFTAPEPGEEVALFAGTRQISGSWSAALQVLSLPYSSCSCVCFSLSHVLTLLFPPGSQALFLAEPSQAVAKEKPLGSWHSPLPRGHSGGSGLELKHSLEPCWMEEEPFGGPALLTSYKVSFSSRKAGSSFPPRNAVKV